MKLFIFTESTPFCRRATGSVTPCPVGRGQSKSTMHRAIYKKLVRFGGPQKAPLETLQQKVSVAMVRHSTVSKKGKESN